MPQSPVTFTTRPVSGFPLTPQPRRQPLSPGTVFLNPATSNTGWNIDLGQLTALWQTGSSNALAFADTPKTSGYCEFTVTTVGTGTLGVGFVPSGAFLPGNTDYIHDNGIGYLSDGRVDFQNSVSFTGSTYGSSVIIGALIKNGKAYFHLNGTYQNSADPVAETGGVDVSTISPALPAIFTNGTGAKVTLNFGGSPFAYSIPSGITSWDGSQPLITSIGGTLSKTLASVTLTSAANLKIAGTLASTLSVLSLASSSKLAINSTLAKTLGAVTLSSASKLAIKATTTKTLGAVVLSSNGVVKLSGSLGVNLSSLVSSSVGKLSIKASLNKTLGSLVGTEVGQLRISGTLSKSLDSINLSSFGHSPALPIIGSCSLYLDLLRLNSNGKVIVTSLRRRGQLGEPINAYKAQKYIRSGRGYWTK